MIFSNTGITILAWALVVIGALITFLAKPILSRRRSDSEGGEQDRENKKLFAAKTVGMWLVIIGAVMIFIAGGMYGRQ